MTRADFANRLREVAKDKRKDAVRFRKQAEAERAELGDTAYAQWDTCAAATRTFGAEFCEAVADFIHREAPTE